MLLQERKSVSKNNVIMIFLFAIIFVFLVAVVLAADTSPPVISNPLPTNNSEITSPVLFGVSTDETAECRYSAASGQNFLVMTPFTNTNALGHNSTLALADYGSYVYFIKCNDTSGNVNPNDYMLSFYYNTTYTYYGVSVGVNLAFHIGTGKDDDTITSTRDYIASSGNNVVVGLASSGTGFATVFNRTYSASDCLITMKESAEDNLFLLGFTKGSGSEIKSKLDYLGGKKIISKTFGSLSTKTPVSYPVYIRLDYDDADITSRGGWAGGVHLLFKNRGNTDRGLPNITIEVIE
jgi:hypothetical protein